MKTDKAYNIMLVDDHALFRNGLKLLLGANKDFKVIAEASNGQECLDLLDVIPVDIILMDISMPTMNGIDATEAAIAKKPDIKVITLSMYGDEAYYNQMMEAGANGFLLKESDIDEVFTALYNVIEGRSYFSQELLQNLIKNYQNNTEKSESLSELSDRELEIISLICKGHSNIEIADKLFVSKRTVEKHRSNILTKTNCKNTASLVMFAIKNNIVEID